MPKSLRNNLIPIILITLVVAYAVMAFARTSSPRTEETSFNALVSEINAGNIKSVSVSSEGNSIRAVKKSDGTAIPGRDHQLALVVRVNQTDQITQHNAVLMAKP